MKHVRINKIYILFSIFIIAAAVLLAGCSERKNDQTNRVLINTPFHYITSASPETASHVQTYAASLPTARSTDSESASPSANVTAAATSKPTASPTAEITVKPTATINQTITASPTITVRPTITVSPTAAVKPTVTPRPTFNIQIIPPHSRSTAANPEASQNNSQSANPSVNKSFEQEVVVLVNEERAKYNLQPLEMTDDALIRVAELRAEECIQSFSHTRPNGTSCFTAFKELGVSYKRAGENIAYGFSTPQSVVNGWMNSEGHRANILDTTFTQIGVGCVYYKGTYYWAQSFTG